VVELLEAEPLVPPWRGFERKLSPAERTLSAKFASTKPVDHSGHEMFQRVTSVVSRLKRIAGDIKVALMKVKERRPIEVGVLQKEMEAKLAAIKKACAADATGVTMSYDIQCARAQSEFAALAGTLEDRESYLTRFLETIEHCIVHYEFYSGRFVIVYGEPSPFSKSAVAKGGRGLYLRELAGVVQAKSAKLLEGEDKDRVVPAELVRIRVQTERAGGDTNAHLAGYEIQDAAKRELYRRFTLHRPKSDVIFGCHAVFAHNGVFYKYRPYAPGIEYAVNSLNRLLLDEISLPTLLIKLEGRSEGNFGEVAYYQASPAVAGSSLHSVLSDPQLVKLVDMRSFSALFISSIFVGSGDGKADNFIVRSTTDGTSDEVRKISLISIDNDIAFCNARLRYRMLLNGKGKLSTDLINILFFFPQMDSPVDPTLRQTLVGRASAPETIMAAWLRDLHQQNERYAQLMNAGFTKRDLDSLKLPMKLPKNCAVLLYRRFTLLHDMLTENPNATHATLLRAFYPAICEYYQLKRARMAKGGEVETMKEVYLDACDDPEVASLMRSNDVMRSRAGFSSASKSREMDREKFNSVFSDEIDVQAEEFLSMIDCSVKRLKKDSAAFVNLGKELNFLKKFRLLNISDEQLGWLFDSWFNPSPDVAPSAVEEVVICCKEEFVSALETSTIVKNLREKLKLKVSFDDVDDPDAESTRFKNALTPPRRDEVHTEYGDLRDSLTELLVKFQDAPATPVALARFVSSVISKVHNSSADIIQKLRADNSVLEHFSTLLLDRAELVPVALELAEKGAFTTQPTLLHNLIMHNKIAAYKELITSILCHNPELMLMREPGTKALAADEILLLPASTGAVKYELLSALINFTRGLDFSRVASGADGVEDSGMEPFPNLLSNFHGEMELIIYAAAFGLQATPEELQSGVISSEKLIAPSADLPEGARADQPATLLYTCLHAFCQWKSERAGLLVLEALETRLKSGELSRAAVDLALWKSPDREGKTAWKLAVDKGCYALADALYEQWGGARHGVELFDSPTGAHILGGTDEILTKISRCFYLVGWSLSCSEMHAMRYTPPTGETAPQRDARLHADSAGRFYASVSPALTSLLNTRTTKAGNSLLYDLTATADHVFTRRLGVNEPTDLLTHVLKCGAKPTFTKRTNRETPITLATRNNHGGGRFKALLEEYQQAHTEGV
jgi:hypothetical protein